MVVTCKTGRDSLPDVGQHQDEGADDHDLQDLPVILVRPITTQSRHPGHHQLTAHHEETGHHGHGKTPAWQAQLNPYGGGGEERERGENLVI